MAAIISASGQNFYPVFSSLSPQGQGYEEFGNAVAVDGDLALAGAWQENTDSNGLDPMMMAGAAYFFYEDPSEGWQISQKVTAPGRAPNDFFGSSVDLSGDLAVIGASSKDDPLKSLQNCGAAYVYRIIGGVWFYQQKLQASDSESDALFGSSVSIQGDFIFIGAPFEDKDENGMNPMTDAGAVYVFKRSASGHFSEVQKVTASDRDLTSLFGSSVSSEGPHMATGAPNASYLTRDNKWIGGVGRVYTYLLETDSTWQETQTIDPGEPHTNQSFGRSLSLDNEVLLIGNPGDGFDDKDRNYLEGAGSAVVWYYSASKTWKFQSKVVAADRAEMDAFGYSVALDQNQAIIGARNKATLDESKTILKEGGAVYVFQKIGIWTLVRKIIARDTYMSDHFGHAVAACDGSFLVGAPNKTEPSKILAGERGKVYFYEPSNAVESTVDLFICEGDSAYLEDAWQTTEGIYTDTFVLPFGFDSVVITTLFINPNYDLNVYARICEGDAMWLEGAYQTTGGTYIDSLQTIYGCDSVIVTTLDVLPTYRETRNISICDGDSLYIGNAYRKTAGIYYDQFATVLGCDSIIEVHLNILPVYEINRNASICRGDSIWIANGFRKTAGLYFDTLSSYFGCDSIVITSLIVHELPQIDLGKDTTICEGETLILDAGDGFASYSWNGGLSVLQSIDVQTAGTYYVDVINSNGCQASDTIVVSVEGCSTSIADPEQLPDVLIYPNPVNDVLNVEPGWSYHGNRITYAIYNLNGREMRIHEEDPGSKLQFDLSDFAPGIYFLRMSNGQEQRTIKLIKK